MGRCPQLFHKTVKLAPDKEIFTEQLKALVNHMAMDSTTSSFDQEFSIEPDAAGLKDKLNTSDKRKILVVEDSSTNKKSHR